MKGQEGLKPHVGNSMGLWNIHVETPQKPEKCGSDCDSVRNEMEKIRGTLSDFPLLYMILPMILNGFDFIVKILRKKIISNSLYICMRVCISMSETMPCAQQTHFLVFLGTHVSQIPFHLDGATWNGSSRDALVHHL